MKNLLSKGDLHSIEQRLDEINEALDLCTDRDEDVKANLELELNTLIGSLEVSQSRAELSERITERKGNVIFVNFKRGA